MTKKYIIFAGVNGSGKSTLYALKNNWRDMPRINTDEIANSLGSWKDTAVQMKAGKIAIKKLNTYFQTGISFNQETTLCGKSILRNITKAKQLGYFIEMHYVGLDSVEIAKERIRYRMSKGGHGISDQDVERRYIETFRNLNQILAKCDLVVLYDNTQSFRRFAIYRKGVLERISHTIPKWYTVYIE